MFRFAVFLAIAVVVQGASASITVTKTDGTGTFTWSDNVMGGKHQVSIVAQPQFVMELTISITGSEEIEWIHCEVNSAIATGSTSLVIIGNTGDIENITRVSEDANDDGELWITLLNTLGDIGDATSGGVIRAEMIVDVQTLNGDVYADVIDVGSFFENAFNMRVETINGNIFGDVESETDGVREVKAANGTIGTALARVSIISEQGINNIEAEIVHANINTRFEGDKGSVARIVASVGDFTGTLNTWSLSSDGADPGIDVEGDITATMAFGNIIAEPFEVAGNVTADITIGGGIHTAGSIDIGGDLDAVLQIDGDVDGNIELGTLKSGASIIIGESLNSDITIQDTAGLVGFITINGENPGTPGTWSGDVVVGTITLAENYNKTIASLGGGAIGVVADWGFHPTDTYPSHGLVVSILVFQSDSTVKIYHYGPIVSTVFDNLKIEESPIDAGDWTDRTADFDFSFDGTDARVLKIDPKDGEQWNTPKDYRITHDIGDLKIPASALNGNADIDISAYTYEFCYN